MSEERASSDERGRWSSRRKMEVVLRALCGEDLDAQSRELGVTAGAIAQWREQFLAAQCVGIPPLGAVPASRPSIRSARASASTSTAIARASPLAWRSTTTTAPSS